MNSIFIFEILKNTCPLQVTINIEALNIHIENSYQGIDNKKMQEGLNEILNTIAYQKLAAAGFKRSKKSLLREWKAHNVLYRWGYKKERTGSVDLNQNESAIRRIGYFFLSLFF